MQGGIRFFVDRGMGSKTVPDGLRRAGWTLTTMDERYGPEASQHVADEDWIRDAASRGEVIVAKDRKIASRPLEAETIYYCSARVFVIANAQITGPEQLQRLLVNEANIVTQSRREGAWVFGVYTDRIDRLRLGFPPR